MSDQNSRDRVSGCTISHHQCKCFEVLTADQRKFMDAHSVTMNYKKREIVFKQGGLVSNVLFVEKGLAKIYMERGDNSLVMMLVPEGNLLGLSSVSEEYSTYQFSAMTYVDSVIRQIDIIAFRRLILENSEFAKEIIEKIISDKLQVYGRFFCLTHKQGFGTVADIILCLANRIFKSLEFDLPLSRKDMAELTGMSQETVIRILKKFSDDNLIMMDGKKFTVTDHERLCRISENG
jgi:CRP/FNR family transcriptional regulator, polysaccharide utilization system transcription regulator